MEQLRVPLHLVQFIVTLSPVASFTKEVKSRLAKRRLVFNGRLADRGLTSLVKEATECNENEWDTK